MNIYNKHYIRTDSENNITYGFSDAFPDNPRNQVYPEDICINEQAGRQFEVFIDGEQRTNFTEWKNPQGVYLYRWIGGTVVVKPPQEIETETTPPALPPPSFEERISLLEALELERILSEK